MNQRLLVISPVRNEAEHVRRVVEAIAAQTRPPDRWLVIDDGSSDDTREILTELAPTVPFMNVMSSRAPAADALAPDRLALAAEARAFNQALQAVPWATFTHVAKLDGDIELPPDYFERLLQEFERHPRRGLAGGTLVEQDGDRWKIDRVPTRYHVRGALKCYTVDCLAQIDGIQERLAWDTIDEVYARMKGFETHSISDLVAVHHRPCGSADGMLRGRARHGRCLRIAHFPLAWVAARSVKAAAERPWGLSGLAFLAGYLGAVLDGTPQVEDHDFKRWMRRELAQRALQAVRLDQLAARVDPRRLGTVLTANG